MRPRFIDFLPEAIRVGTRESVRLAGLGGRFRGTGGLVGRSPAGRGLFVCRVEGTAGHGQAFCFGDQTHI